MDELEGLKEVAQIFPTILDGFLTEDVAKKVARFIRIFYIALTDEGFDHATAIEILLNVSKGLKGK